MNVFQPCIRAIIRYKPTPKHDVTEKFGYNDTALVGIGKNVTDTESDDFLVYWEKQLLL